MIYIDEILHTDFNVFTFDFIVLKTKEIRQEKIKAENWIKAIEIFEQCFPNSKILKINIL